MYPRIDVKSAKEISTRILIMLNKRISRWLILVFLLILFVEGGATLVCWFLLTPLHLSGFLWNPDLEQARNNWDAVSSAVDDEIGGYRVSGAKDNSEFPDGAFLRISFWRLACWWCGSRKRRGLD
jgi:hypothetical protein